MKKGFTLLELIVVVIVLGILATLAATQYVKMVERSRGTEARVVLGAIRTNEAALKLQNGSVSSVNADVGIGLELPSVCTTTHYFSYGMSGASGNAFTATATRCTATSKNPGYAAGGSLTLITNFDNGSDTWSFSAPY